MKTILQPVIVCTCLLWAALAQGASFVQGINTTVSETNGVAVVNIQRTGELHTTASVDYATTNGTATTGNDYVAASETLTFLPGVSNLTVTINLVNDAMPEGTVIRVAPKVYRALGNDSNKDVVYLILGAVPPKKFPLGGRTLLGDGIPNRDKVPRWKRL